MTKRCLKKSNPQFLFQVKLTVLDNVSFTLLKIRQEKSTNDGYRSIPPLILLALMHGIPRLPLSPSWKGSGSEVRFFHCKWKSRTECCRCPNGRPLCVGASTGACMTVFFKVHFPQGFALPNLLCSMHACLCEQ